MPEQIENLIQLTITKVRDKSFADERNKKKSKNVSNKKIKIDLASAGCIHCCLSEIHFSFFFRAALSNL